MQLSNIEIMQANTNHDDKITVDNVISSKAALVENSKDVEGAQPMPEPHADASHSSSQENEDDEHPIEEVNSCHTVSEEAKTVDEKGDATVATLPSVEDVAVTFPQRLMEILDNEANAEVIGWLPHGRAFRIYRKPDFESIVLPQYFHKQSKYSSFTRKLNRWGFVRVTRGPETGAYYHQSFKRGEHRLCVQMSCHSIGTNKSSAAASSANNASGSPSNMPHPIDFAPTAGFRHSFPHGNNGEMGGPMMHPHHQPYPPYPHMGHPQSQHPFYHPSASEDYPPNYMPHFYQQQHPYHMPPPQDGPPLLNGPPEFHHPSYPNQFPHDAHYPHGPHPMHLGSYQDPQSLFGDEAGGLPQRQMEPRRDEEISPLTETGFQNPDSLSLSVSPHFQNQRREVTSDSGETIGSPPQHDESQAYPYRHPYQYANYTRAGHDGSRHPSKSEEKSEFFSS